MHRISEEERKKLLDCTYPVSKDGCNGGDSIDGNIWLSLI